MTFLMYGVNGVNLQATLSASSAEAAHTYKPHHPITCTSELRLEEDGTFACEHTAVPGDDERTIYCINHSIGLLLMEIAQEKFCGLG